MIHPGLHHTKARRSLRPGLPSMPTICRCIQGALSLLFGASLKVPCNPSDSFLSPSETRSLPNFGISIFPSCSPSLNPSLCPSLSSVSRRQVQLSALRLQVLQVPSFDPCLPAFLSSSSYVKFLIPLSFGPSTCLSPSLACSLAR